MSAADEEVRRAIVERVARNAADWFPGTPQGPRVHLRPLAVGRRSRVYAVSLGEPTAAPVAVAKVRSPHSAVSSARGQGRPTLAPAATDEAELTEREYDGLRVLESAFSDRDPRFSVIRPLAHLPAHHTVLMGFVPGSSTRDLLVRSSRLRPSRMRRPPSPPPDTVLPFVGAWLRTFQEATPAAPYPARQATGGDVVAHFSALEEFLHRSLGRRAGEVARAGASLAAEVFTTGALPLAVGHGDFAPRNVLVDTRGRVVVIDPLVRWAVPAQEDLCRFLVGMRLLGLQLHSRGAAFSADTLDRWEQLVITGYYGHPVPVAPLRCYQLLVLLDKWSALQQPAGARRLRASRRVSQYAATGYVRDQAHRVLDMARSGT